MLVGVKGVSFGVYIEKGSSFGAGRLVSCRLFWGCNVLTFLDFTWISALVAVTL